MKKKRISTNMLLALGVIGMMAYKYISEQFALKEYIEILEYEPRVYSAEYYED
jgi:hypothetical protein